MLTLVILLAILLGLIGWAIALFFFQEYRKKFSYMWGYYQACVQTGRVVVFSTNQAPRPAGFRRRQDWNIALRSAKPFAALVGFRLTVPGLGTGYDYYGFVKAEQQGDKWVAVVRIFIGQWADEEGAFQAGESIYLLDRSINDAPVTASASDEDQALTPTVAYPGHWYQYLGFYG